MPRRTVPTGDIDSTETRVLKAATSLFGERGFDATGIRDIANAAGVTVSALYHYMSSKHDLLTRLMCSVMDNLIESGRHVVDSHSGDPVLTIYDLSRSLVGINSLNPKSANLVRSEIRYLDATDRARIVDLRDTYEDMWTQAIERGIAEGDFAPNDARLARLAILEMCTGTLNWFRAGGKNSVEEVCDTFGEIALRVLEGSASGFDAQRYRSEAVPLDFTQLRHPFEPESS